MLDIGLNFLPKDFIETTEGLIFAVVQHGTEQSDNLAKVLCFLRYIKAQNAQNQSWQKIGTDAANSFLKQNHPQYQHYSPVLDVGLHAVEVSKIVQHHQPQQRLQQLLQQEIFDCVEQDCFSLCHHFQHYGLNLAQFGITGSMLINTQQTSSDIDLICYDRGQFQQARNIVANLIDNATLAPLSDNDWQEAYGRRACSLSLAEYIWHEQRKFNKAVINGRKFDLNYVNKAPVTALGKYKKHGKLTLQCKVTDASLTFDYPAIYKIGHPTISEVLCFTATYMGQATEGEMIEVSGFLEDADNGHQRVIVGTNREAPGEYIKVIQCHN